MKYVWDESTEEFIKWDDGERESTIIIPLDGRTIPISKIPLEIANALGGETLYKKVKKQG